MLIGRLISRPRSFGSIVAGLAHLAVLRFLALSVIGAVFDAALTSGGGGGLGAGWTHIAKGFGDVGGALALPAVSAGVVHRVEALRSERQLDHAVSETG